MNANAYLAPLDFPAKGMLPGLPDSASLLFWLRQAGVLAISIVILICGVTKSAETKITLARSSGTYIPTAKGGSMGDMKLVEIIDTTDEIESKTGHPRLGDQRQFMWSESREFVCVFGYCPENGFAGFTLEKPSLEPKIILVDSTI
jgi:hypothetical protein